MPSIVFGLWGRDYLVQPVRGLSAWLHEYFGWIPIFGSEGPYGQSILLGSVVLAIMVLPDHDGPVARSSPRRRSTNQEAALALGATKWEMIRMRCCPMAGPASSPQ